MQPSAVHLPFATVRPALAGATLVSLLLHFALLVLLLVGQLAQPIEPPRVSSISVELIRAQDFAAATAPPPADEGVALAPDAGRSTPPAQSSPLPAANGPYRATRFYAAGLLAEPASANLLRAMGTLDVAERAVQLCDIEAMEQVRRARPDYDPDMVVPYAMAETTLRDGILAAPGGAFRSRREWYGISFRCAPAADLVHVQSFEFTLGEPVPHEEWDAHYLTAEEVDE